MMAAQDHRGRPPLRCRRRAGSIQPASRRGTSAANLMIDGTRNSKAGSTTRIHGLPGGRLAGSSFGGIGNLPGRCLHSRGRVFFRPSF